MDKQLDTNTTVFHVRTDFDKCSKIVSKFVRKYFGSDEFVTVATHQNSKRLTIGFGYKIDGYPREVGHTIFDPGIALDLCLVIINNFAKKRFVEHLETTDVVYRLRAGSS